MYPFSPGTTLLRWDHPHSSPGAAAGVGVVLLKQGDSPGSSPASSAHHSFTEALEDVSRDVGLPQGTVCL